MQYKLSALETLGVVTVGAVVALAVDKMIHSEEDPIEHHRALMAAVTGVYVIGVVVGTMRPDEGWDKKLIGQSED